MYRRYEDPYKLQKQYDELQNRVRQMIQDGAEPEDLVNEYDEMEDLRQRINFAWQDDEAEVEGYE